MSGACFAHIGGAVAADHGPLTLAEAAALIAFYNAEAQRAADAGPPRWALRCADRAGALAAVVHAAARWRRAAGWADPGEADEKVRQFG